MKALVLTSVDGAIEFKETNDPFPTSGEVLIRLAAAALNRRDFWITRGGYPNIEAPCVLGSDGAGIVEKAGEGVDSSLVGKEVLINPSLQWGSDQLVQGPDFRILGMPDNGTFAEYISVPVQQITEKPSHLTPYEAAALPLAGLTAYRALFSQGKLKPEESILITGIGGGVATIALKMAQAAGARVFVSSSCEHKISQAITLGA